VTIGRLMVGWYDDVWVESGVIDRWGNVIGRQLSAVRFKRWPANPHSSRLSRNSGNAQWMLTLWRLFIAWLP
jgi:hypothetical protein